MNHPDLARVKAMLRLLVDDGHLTPMGERQILKLWEAE